MERWGLSAGAGDWAAGILSVHEALHVHVLQLLQQYECNDSVRAYSHVVWSKALPEAEDSLTPCDAEEHILCADQMEESQ